MARKKRITLILIILSTLLLAGPGVVDIANAEPISSSIPTDFEQQSVSSTLNSSDSINDGSAQESVKWNQGWNSFDGNWFYADSVNPVSLHSGWLYTNGAWYWLDPSTHAMAIGLHECNGSAYWFDASGAMATGWVLDGGTWYYATGSGALASGWLNLNGTWYWLEPDAGDAMATGFHECNGSLYWFNASGAMATGWLLDGGTWYYAMGSGALARGPVSVGGVPYCFDARTGAMLTGYQTDAQGVRRYFGSCGPLNGWGFVDGSWYWFADGIASTGWLYTGGSWYWLDPDAGGAMVTGLHACNDSVYWFSASGAMATGWVLDGGTWYYATGSGALASGWLSLSGAWYWLDPSTHAMTTGVQTIGSCEYIFNGSVRPNLTRSAVRRSGK